MKNFIDVTQSLHITPEQELRIYARFLEKRQRNFFLSKVRYYTKLAVYSLGLVLIFGSVLLSFPQQSQQLYTRILSNKAVEVYTPNPGTVHADAIGKVLSLQGDVILTRDGKEYPLEQIFSDTTVVLKPGAVLTFQIEGGLQTQLLGPAKFQLYREGESSDTIILDVQEGNILQVESFSQHESQTKTTEMTIKTPQLQLASIRSDKKVKLQIDATHKNPMIANQGDAITITTTDAEQGVIVSSLQPQQVVVINDAGKLEQEIISLTKKIIIGDQEINFEDIFAVVDTGFIQENMSSGGQELVSTGIVAVSGETVVKPSVSLAVVAPHAKQEPSIVANIEDTKSDEEQSPQYDRGYDTSDVLGTKNLLNQKDFSALKLQLYAPNFRNALRTMLLAYARADYQMFLTEKKEVSQAIYNLYDILGFDPHIRVIARDPQLAVRQYQSLIDQLLLNINRSRGVPVQYINKIMSIEVMFMIMKSVGYGKFVHSELDDDALWKLIGDEVKKVAK